MYTTQEGILFHGTTWWFGLCESDEREKSKLKKRRRELTINRIPHKHSTRLKPSPHLINPLIIIRHPSRLHTISGDRNARLRLIPEPIRMDIPPEFQRVKTVRSSERILHDMQRAREDGALRWSAHVSIATDEENDGCEEEDDGWESEGKPEADVLCWIC